MKSDDKYGADRRRESGDALRSTSESREWEAQLPSEMRKIYRHFKSYDETPRLRRGGTFQDLLLPLNPRRKPEVDDTESAGVDNNNNNDDDSRNSPRLNAAAAAAKLEAKSVAFDLGPYDAKDEAESSPVIDSSLPNVAGGVKSAPPLAPSSSADAAASERLYRRHMARYYARSATKFDDVKDLTFPELPDLPAGAVSPFLNADRNEQIWRWLNRDFCKTKLDYFLSLCS